MSRGVVAVIPSKYKDVIDEELTLVKSIYDNIVDVILVRKPNSKYYLSKPKIDYLKSMRDNIESIIIMDTLKPRHIVNLYRELRREIIDRVQLILKIFAYHAGSKEAKLQIELAQLRHELPLIREMIRYAKLSELPGYLGGGRYAVDKYYRQAKSRIARIRRELERLRKIRELRRTNRSRLGYPHVSIVGYTCAGKTTLFNYLAKSMKPVGPEPFTTLSPKASSIEYDGLKMILIDTVGFIRDIPLEIIEAFYATLEEIVESDAIIIVLDASKDIRNVVYEVNETKRILSNIGVHGKPMLIALNKIDIVSNDKLETVLEIVSKHFNRDGVKIVPISALKGINIDLLLSELISLLR